MSGSGREALPVVREWSGDLSECPGCPPGYPGAVGRPSQIFGRGRRPSLMSGSGREALPDVREWSRDPF